MPSPSRLGVAVAATFTAEPIVPYLEFWLGRLWGGGTVEVAPFDQVYQQLLDPASALRTAEAGVILLQPADWLATTGAAGSGPPLPEVPGLERHRLPDGLEVAHLNRYETEYVHREIFVDRAYLRHGITLKPGATVVDIGANIGLFTLFVQAEAPGARVIALEPSPAAFAALAANVSRHGDRVTALPYGVGDRDGTASFTAYTRSSVFSSFHADADADRSAIRAVIHNVVRTDTSASPQEADALADALVADRLESRVVEVPMRTVSSILAEVGVGGDIDLLKVDAEKSEQAVLAGIQPADWARIRQVVIEVHDTVGDRARDVQALLERHGFSVTRDQESLLSGSGLHNLYAVRPAADASAAAEWPVPAAAMTLPPRADEFLRTVRDVAPSLTTPLTIVCCPAAGGSASVIPIESALTEAVRDLPSVSVVTSAAWVDRYRVEDLHDRASQAAGRIPYTPDGFAALATAIARAVWTSRQPRAKVIVVDADHTLWDGVLAEDGIGGLTIGPGRAALHRFLLDQRATGVLLAVCSKNEASDVLGALGAHPDSLIRPEHLSAHAIGWNAKSAGLEAIANELNLGLDSLVFLDDNPAECAEVAARCRGVVTWCVPADERDLPAFLDHLWPLDVRRVTDEDRRRADLYRENRERQTFQSTAASYQAFIDGLQLAVDVRPVDAGTLPRALQLFERTNQFNFTTWRPTAAELTRAMASGLDLQVVRVEDRFGDYGLTGLIGVRADGPALVVEACLLSCRVLGKGVEHRVLAHLGRMALARGLATVRLPFRPSPRNEPARRFADAVGVGRPAAGGEIVYEWPADEAAAVSFVAPATAANASADDERPRQTAVAAAGTAAIETLSRIPVALRTPAAVRRAAVRAREGAQVAAPATPVEQRLAAIWADCLRFDEVGVDEDFFALGGDSITAVMIASRAARAGLRVTPRDVLTQGSIRQLAAVARIEREVAGAAPPSAALLSEWPATPMQALYYAQYVAGLDAGFERFTLTVRGALDPDRFLRAWQRVVDRHDALRSSFHDVDGSTRQRIAPAATVPVEALDWRGVPASELDARLRHLADTDRARRFDLTEAPLMRVTAVRVADDEWRVYWAFHHLVADGWSWPLVAADLAAAYAAPDRPLPTAPSIAHFARHVAERSTAPLEAYWRQHLGGLRAPTALAATVHGRVPTSTTRELEATAFRPLTDWTRRQRVTLGATLAAAWALVVADECDADDAVIGVAVSGRPADLADAERMVGTFVDNLPLRVACDESHHPAAWLQDVQTRLTDASEHQGMPPDRLHALSGLPAGQRLFDSLLVVQNYAGVDHLPLALGPSAGAPVIAAVEMPVRTGVPVTVVATPGTRLGLTVTGAVDAADAARWLDGLVRVLGALPAASTIGALRRRRERRAAPPSRAGMQVGAASGPSTPLEAQIAGVWAEVLGHSGFGSDDNFFDLGGHSLLMLGVQTRLSASLGRPLSIVELFQYPTIRGLAGRLASVAPDGHVDAAHARASRQRAALARPRPAAVRS